MLTLRAPISLLVVGTVCACSTLAAQSAIRLDSIVTLGPEPDTAGFQTVPSVIRRTEAGDLIVSFEPAPFVPYLAPRLYSKTGRYLSSVQARDERGGELRDPTVRAVLPGDSLLLTHLAQ